jgi:hypothetical protein
MLASKCSHIAATVLFKDRLEMKDARSKCQVTRHNCCHNKPACLTLLDIDFNDPSNSEGRAQPSMNILLNTAPKHKNSRNRGASSISPTSTQYKCTTRHRAKPAAAPAIKIICRPQNSTPVLKEASVTGRAQYECVQGLKQEKRAAPSSTQQPPTVLLCTSCANQQCFKKNHTQS